MGMIQNTMWNEVPEADVVITNPTLGRGSQIRPGKMKAPKVLARALVTTLSSVKSPRKTDALVEK